MPENRLTFEYFSTFAPVSDTLLAVSSLQKTIDIDTEIFPLQWMNNSYIIHTKISEQWKQAAASSVRGTTRLG